VIAAHDVVPHEAWLEARIDLLAKEREFTRLRDELAERRRALPWEEVEKTYVFDGPDGQRTLGALFEGRSQLIVYHFMYPADWDEGCSSCSFWADNFDPIIVHLNARDVTMVAVSRAPLAKLIEYRRRMGWSFAWFSSAGNDFNTDLGVSFTPEQAEQGGFYNYRMAPTGPTEREGMSVFFKDDAGRIFHTYSAYARGIDLMNTAYNYLDTVPKGRDEEDGPQRWVRRHDQYAS
jgi:predicted dithiol-disulfide oxidoreductase (DUF899 family)